MPGVDGLSDTGIRDRMLDGFVDQTIRASMAQPFPGQTWDQYVQPRDQGRMLGVVDMKAALELGDDEIIHQVQACRDESEQQREPLLEQWEYLELLYQNKLLNLDTKDDWQSALSFPEIFTRIERIVAMFKASLLDAPEYFLFRKRLPDANEVHIRWIQRVCQVVAEESHYLDEYPKSMKQGLLLGSSPMGIFWHAWEETSPTMVDVPIYQDIAQALHAQAMGYPTTQRMVSVEPRSRSGVRCRAIPLEGFFPDPYGERPQDWRYAVHEYQMDDACVMDALAAGQFDSITDLGPPVTGDVESVHRWRLTELDEQRSSVRKRHKITDAWLDLRDRRGNIVARNYHVIVGNDRAILHFRHNPFWKGFLPYIWTTPIPWAGRAWGWPSALPAAPMMEAKNEIINLMIDDLKFTVQKMFYQDLNTQGLNSDIGSAEPGKVWKGRGPAGIGQVGPFTSSIQQAFPMLNIFSQGMDDSLRVSEFQGGTPSFRGRPTAKQVEIQTGRGDQQMSMVAKDLERNDVTRAIWMMWQMWWQFGTDLSNPKLRQLVQAWAGPVEFLDEQTRFEMMDADFDIEVKGMSGVMSREELIPKLMQAMQLGQSMPLPPLNVIAIYYQIIQAMGLDPTRHLGLPPSPEEATEALMLMQMQQAQQMAQGGAGPSGGRDRNPESAGGSANPAPPAPSAPGPEGMPQAVNQFQ